MKTRFITLLALAGALILSSCDNSGTDVEPVETDFLINLTFPQTLTNPSLESVDIRLTEVFTGNVIERSFEDIGALEDQTSKGGSVTMSGVLEGTYTISVNSKVQYTDSRDLVRFASLRSTQENFKLQAPAQGNPSTDILLSYTPPTEDFVIEEIFFTGTLTPEGKQYTGDKYFKLTNNSYETLYADGIALLGSAFLTTTNNGYNPDIMSDYFAVNAIYVIPGNGTDVPVEPGESLILCDNGINHKEPNSNSIDLTIADFEWYDISSNPNIMDIDNPDVPNLDKWYSNTLTIWGPHNRGFASYAIARMQVGSEEFLRDYTYHYDYLFVYAGGEILMEFDEYKVPNSWIIDAVNLSVASLFEWIVTDPSLDRGWTYCGDGMSDPERYGKAVRRKVDRVDDNGRRILKDTNNSTEDFDAEVVPSLFE